MNCPNCGAPLKSGASFCPVCGREVGAGYSVPMPERAVMDGKPMSKKSLIAIIIITVVSLCAAAFCIYWFVFRDTGSVCARCDKEFEGSGKYCDECKETEDTTDNGVCLICSDEFSDKGLICENCFGDADQKKYSDGYYCYDCDKTLRRDTVAWVDRNGNVYCEKCNKDYECDECDESMKKGEGISNSRGFYCEDCIEELIVDSCDECGDDIYKNDDYVSVDDGDYYYCMDCCRGVCENCSEVIMMDDTQHKHDGDMYCDECYSGKCCECEGLLLEDEYMEVHGDKYCMKCYEEYAEPEGVIGKCDDCGEKIYDGENYCELEEKYYCIDCYEENPVECYYCGEDILDGLIYNVGNEYSCKDCKDGVNSGKNCEDCGSKLDKDDDDDVCEDCADYSCADCGEVITSSEVEFEDDDGNVFCNDCAQ